ncbi:hypothetical protein MUK42_16598 [Musa troglodytarum]|uniref:Uncharacterized protein n=1 Tax=Musa troglodytarum TaxID=320322 RepID=A0A9E7H4X6_9LILI|nr:hypothetical protein MUK42_16598 [Musa troglodytarum]
MAANKRWDEMDKLMLTQRKIYESDVLKVELHDDKDEGRRPQDEKKNLLPKTPLCICAFEEAENMRIKHWVSPRHSAPLAPAHQHPFSSPVSFLGLLLLLLLRLCCRPDRDHLGAPVFPHSLPTTLMGSTIPITVSFSSFISMDIEWIAVRIQNHSEEDYETQRGTGLIYYLEGWKLLSLPPSCPCYRGRPLSPQPSAITPRNTTVRDPRKRTQGTELELTFMSADIFFKNERRGMEKSYQLSK